MYWSAMSTGRISTPKMGHRRDNVEWYWWTLILVVIAVVVVYFYCNISMVVRSLQDGSRDWKELTRYLFFGAILFLSAVVGMWLEDIQRR